MMSSTKKSRGSAEEKNSAIGRIREQADVTRVNKARFQKFVIIFGGGGLPLMELSRLMLLASKENRAGSMLSAEKSMPSVAAWR